MNVMERKLLKNTIAALAVAVMFAAGAIAQQKPGDGTPSQRLEVMRQKLETMRRSLNGMASVMKEENKGDSSKNDKDKLDTPLARIQGLEKDAGRLASEVN